RWSWLADIDRNSAVRPFVGLKGFDDRPSGRLRVEGVDGDVDRLTSAGAGGGDRGDDLAEGGDEKVHPLPVQRYHRLVVAGFADEAHRGTGDDATSSEN